MLDLSQRLTSALVERYRIERVLGRGGMATVFLAYDLRHARQVAIKVLDPEVAAVIGPERFLREIATVARLTHPHILPLHDSGVADGLLYYVMPYVDGESLRERLRREKQLPLEDALRIARETADALSYAHSRGVVHRDVKPENILLEQNHAVVADFGIARAVAAAGLRTQTPTGIAVGTPAYMSPEQTAGDGCMDGRSDLYSLGCMLYEMLAGQPPFTGPTAESLAHQHLNVSPRVVTELRPAVPAAVAAALHRALAKTPADRFNPVARFGEALGNATNAPPVPGPQGSTPHRVRWVFAGALAAVAILAIAVHLAVRSGWLLAPGRSGPPAHAGPRDWILVADFDGPSGDPSLTRTAREIVSAALDRSPVVRCLPREQIQVLLQHASKPDTSELTPRLAHEIAYRGNVRTVLEGDVARVGSTYTVSLRADDVEQNRQILSLSDAAGSEDALIPVLTRLTRQACEQLGETPEDLRTTHIDEWPVSTKSFEAYRRWAEGMRLYNQGDFAGALKLHREAVANDPAFGVAWASIAFDLAMIGLPDSALACFEEAQRHPESLTPAYRLLNDGRVLQWRGDVGPAMEIYRRVERLYPGSMEARYALNYESIHQWSRGRLEDALALHERAEEGFVSSQMAHNNRATMLIALGRCSEARQAMHALREGPWLYRNVIALALAERNWSRAESLAVAFERDPGNGPFVLGDAATARATVAAVRGEVTIATEHLRRANELRHGGGRLAMAAKSGRASALLASASGRPVPAVPPWIESDTSTSALISRAYVAAMAGDTVRAHRLYGVIRGRRGVRMGATGSTPQFLEACIAMRGGRWDRVIALVSESAREGADHGSSSYDMIGVAPERLIVAQAYERLGQPDSAAAFYERLLAPESTRMLDSFARQRLLVLYAGMGRIVRARAHLSILERDFTRPDPDLRRLLDEARSAVRDAEALAVKI